ncbi:MAG: glucose-6-phosphate dehydrogenase [Patescibacteria group bacterium]
MTTTASATPPSNEHQTPTVFVIFGKTGNLAQKKLLPALLNLYSKKILPKQFAIVGIGRRVFTREDFRQYVRDNMHIKVGQYKEEDIKHFLDHMTYVQGFFDSKDLYTELAEKLDALDKGFRRCSNKLFHLSVSPDHYELILSQLSDSGLTVPCGGNQGWTRILVEKPFGNNSETARSLDALLGKLFDESQIFRIDHYLAKEAMQNIIAFRFANSLFEPLWNKDYIDKVHIKLLEKIDTEGRGAFYDNVGALKDVGQNHMLQMLALVAMENPDSFEADDVRGERAKVLGKLLPITKKTIAHHATRAQYEGYQHEKGVTPKSQTETYFRLETYIDNGRWKKVPFYLESGKALSEARAEIDVYFKNPSSEERQNVLTFKIQPDEGIKIRFWVKTPGFDLKVEPKTLKFKYADFQSLDLLPDAYERVLYDAVVGDQTLFASTEEVMAAWDYITPIVEAWSEVPLKKYKKGSEYVD